MSVDRRRLSGSGLAVWGAGLRSSRLAHAAAAAQTASRWAPGASLSRQFAHWVRVGCQLPAGQQAVAFVTDEEAGVRNGATILVSGKRD